MGGAELCCRGAGVRLAVLSRGVEAGVRRCSADVGVVLAVSSAGFRPGGRSGVGLGQHGMMPSALSAANVLVNEVYRINLMHLPIERYWK
jgi:hypothetical protein